MRNTAPRSLGASRSKRGRRNPASFPVPMPPNPGMPSVEGEDRHGGPARHHGGLSLTPPVPDFDPPTRGGDPNDTAGNHAMAVRDINDNLFSSLKQ